jgi:hypothetical protein
MCLELVLTSGDCIVANEDHTVGFDVQSPITSTQGPRLPMGADVPGRSRGTLAEMQGI